MEVLRTVLLTSGISKEGESLNVVKKTEGKWTVCQYMWDVYDKEHKNKVGWTLRKGSWSKYLPRGITRRGICDTTEVSRYGERLVDLDVCNLLRLFTGYRATRVFSRTGPSTLSRSKSWFLKWSCFYSISNCVVEGLFNEYHLLDTIFIFNFFFWGVDKLGECPDSFGFLNPFEVQTPKGNLRRTIIVSNEKE